MIAHRVNQQSFKGPNPLRSSSTKNRRYASLAGLFKSDSCTSLQDMVITSHKPKTRPKPKSRETTLIPLLGRDGSTAALVPESGRRGSEKHEASSQLPASHGLRFPLLSPTRQETVLFLRMKAMENAARLTSVSVTDAFTEPSKSFTAPDKILESPKGTVTNPSTRGHTRGRTSVELSKVPPSRDRQVHMEKMGYTATGDEAKKGHKDSARCKKREKIIVSSKYGYHSRSNSATYKRLNGARTKMDDLLETQVIEVTSKSELPDIEGTKSYRDTSGEMFDSSRGISISKKRSHLSFNLDPGIYESFKESKDLNILYKKTVKSGKSSKSSRSSARSITVVLPKVERELTTLSSLPTERSDRARPTTPYNQYVLEDQTPRGADTHPGNLLVCDVTSPVDRPSTSEVNVPLSLDALANPEFQRNLSRNDKVLPDIRKSITFDNSHPISPKKRSRRGKKPRTKLSEEGSNEIAFLLDDSKSLTPSPLKTQRPYRQKRTPLETISNFDPNGVIANPLQKTGLAENKEQEMEMELSHNEKKCSRSSSKFSERKSYADTPPVALSVKELTSSRQNLSPPVLHDSDDEFYDEFENI